MVVGEAGSGDDIRAHLSLLSVSITNLAYCLEGLDTVAGAREEAERCARLIGAAEGLHGVVGVPVYIYYEPHRSLYERTVAAVGSRLGESTSEEARAGGRTMTLPVLRPVEDQREHRERGKPLDDVGAEAFPLDLVLLPGPPSLSCPLFLRQLALPSGGRLDGEPAVAGVHLARCG